MGTIVRFRMVATELALETVNPTLIVRSPGYLATMIIRYVAPTYTMTTVACRF